MNPWLPVYRKVSSRRADYQRNNPLPLQLSLPALPLKMLIRYPVILPVAALAAVVAVTSNVLKARESDSVCMVPTDYCCAQLLTVR